MRGAKEVACPENLQESQALELPASLVTPNGD